MLGRCFETLSEKRFLPQVPKIMIMLSSLLVRLVLINSTDPVSQVCDNPVAFNTLDSAPADQDLTNIRMEF